MNRPSRTLFTLTLALLAVPPLPGEEIEAERSEGLPHESLELPSGPMDIAEYVFHRALERMSEGSVERAVDLLSLAVEMQPDVALYREALGDAYLAASTGDSALLAKTEYQIALDLEPGRTRAREGLAQVALLTGRIDEAIDVLEDLAFQGGELHSEYLPDLVSLYIAGDEARRGIAALGPHVESGETPTPVLLHLATLYRYEEELHEALDLLTRVKSRPNEPEETRAFAGRLEAQWLRAWRESEAGGR